MIGMIQILTYLLCFYLVLKGIEILQIALASNSPTRKPIIILGLLTLFACVFAAGVFTEMQDNMAKKVSFSPPQAEQQQ